MELCNTTIKNDGNATFSLTGTASVGNTLSIVTETEDPDGTARIDYKWEQSTDGTTWDLVGSQFQYKITEKDANKSLRVGVILLEKTGACKT